MGTFGIGLMKHWTCLASPSSMLYVSSAFPFRKIYSKGIPQVSRIKSVGFGEWLMMGRYRPQDSLFLLDYVVFNAEKKR